jgi:hypothetical protein
MKSFSQHLEEAPAWTKSASEHIFTLDDVHLPLSTPMFRRIFGSGKPPRMRVFHVTNPQYLDDMIALQGKRKSISAFTRMDRDIIARGINVSGGLVFQLDADILVSSPFDIMSRPDKTGRRWLELYYLASIDRDLGHVLHQDGQKAINALVTKYLGNKVPLTSTFKIWTDLDPRNPKSPLGPAKRSGKKGGGVSMFSTRRDTIKKETNKILRDMIKDYIDAMEGVMKKHAGRLGKTLWKHAATSHYDRPADSGYDEYVVNRIKIERVLIDSETVKHAFGGFVNMEREERDGHFAQLLVKLGDKGIPYTVFDNASQVVRAVAAAADKGSQLR